MRLADRLRAARHHRFLGRAAERAQFQAAITAPELPLQVLFVHGPGGVGKTSLLAELAYQASRAGDRRTARADAGITSAEPAG